ncbi:MAG: hypothetical protein VX100_12670 [Pseudomonadota bacterium]|uniref:hypothetical protein n=1 Tax=Pseudoalteromonas TaxID=53246 RepID=UPI00026CB806|nr:hypothetical protein [Pseudoalteromonas spongiae]ATC98409.1 hypothetical protein PSPO_a1309 [Pseudoalteromonas spongiae UST010723-006]MEC8326926.1 hypothetical protein [Pseudomonadota bacterium]
MVVYIIITLIVALIVIGVWVNAVQQHKEKQNAERRQELTKQKKIIEETEEVLMNSANIPMSKALFSVLYRRIYTALAVMAELSPNSKEIRNRLTEAKERIENSSSQDSSAERIALPDNEKQVIALLQGVKKLRSIVRSEHSKGKIDTQVFLNEDKRLEKMQLQVNIDSQLKRGKAARSANMLGSARQYFEKALAVINSLNFTDEYVASRKQEIEDMLEEIMTELKATNASDAKKKLDNEKDDLDELFAPKKKW